MTSLLLIQGPNLNYLGKREPQHYGTTSAAELDAMVRAHAVQRGYAVDIFYTQVEGHAIERIYAATEDGTNVLVMNPAGMTYAGYAVRDCLRAVAPVLPYVEVHIMHLDVRGTRSVPGEAAAGVIHGLGVRGYLVALEAALMIAGHPGLNDIAKEYVRDARV